MHPTVQWPPQPILAPAPLAGGMAYDAPDANGAVDAWAYHEAVVEYRFAGQFDARVKAAVGPTLAAIKDKRFVAADIADYFDGLSETQLAAVRNSCNPTYHINAHGQLLPAKSADNEPVADAIGLECGLDGALLALRALLQTNVNRGVGQGKYT